MKATALIIILFVMPGLAQKSNLVEEESCSAPSSHFHRHSDLRIAVVEVRDHDRCGFNYLDLEEQTVGLDHRMEFAPDFAIAREKANKEDPSELRNVLQTRQHVKRGLRGTVVYCRVCRMAFILKLVSETRR